ncbi:MAG: hypothetical protein K1X74_11710 [Pirellulales bacterium]|nr:hypothetical protein [Pirellulales bacterium]
MTPSTETTNGAAVGLSPELVDRIVREVLVRLAPAAASQTPSTAAVAPDLLTLVLDERVITLRQLAEHLGSARTLQVAPRAVITPAARDLLRQRGVALVRASAVPAPAAAKSTQRVTVAVAETKFDASALIRDLRKLPREVEALASCGLVTVAREMADRVARGGDLGVLLTDQAAAALCLTNRHAGVRAMAPADEAGLRRGCAAVGANLLVVDLQTVRPHQVKLLVQQFCLGAPYRCLEPYGRALAAAAAS